MLLGNSMSNQSLLALFRMTHLRFYSNFACQFTSMIGATVPNFRKIGQVFFTALPKIEILPRKSRLTATSRHSLINNSNNNWARNLNDTFLERSLKTLSIKFYKTYNQWITSNFFFYIYIYKKNQEIYIFSWCDDLWPHIDKIYIDRSDPN